MFTERRPINVWLIFGLVYVLQTTLSFEINPITKNVETSDMYHSRSTDPQKNEELLNDSDWVDSPPKVASQEPSYHHRESELQGKQVNPDYVDDFEVLGEQPVMVAKRYLCRQSFVYNPVSGRCQPSLSALRKGRASRPVIDWRQSRH